MSKEIGKCLCGHVEVECYDLPKNVAACYCEDCQKISGGGPSYNIVVSDEKIKIVKGKPSTYKMKAASGNSLERVFCPKCGSAICSKLTSRTVWKAGLFNHLKDLEVAINVWASSSNKLSQVDRSKQTFEQGR